MGAKAEHFIVLFEGRDLKRASFHPIQERGNMGEPRVISQSAQALRIVAFSDCRVQDLKSIVEWVKGLLNKPDLIVYAGDDVERFVPDDDTNYFEQLAALSRYGVVAVVGNDDGPENRALIRGDKVHEVHSQPVAIGPFLVVGVEGAAILEKGMNLGFTLYAEPQISRHLDHHLHGHEKHTIILVSHTPPRGCLDQAIRHNVGHIGSIAVRDAVEGNRRIALVVSGHAHLCGGRDDKLGHAVVLNAASHDKVGSPAKIATLLLQPSGTVEDIQWTELVSSFQVAEINGIGGKYAERLAQAGIATIEHLAAASPDTVRQALGRKAHTTDILIARARARLNGSPYLTSKPDLPDKPRLYLDIETDFQQSYVWLVGVADEHGDDVRQFFASHPDNEGAMLRELAAFLSNMDGRTMIHFSGSWFDGRVLVERMDSHEIISPPLLLGSVDCLHSLRNTLALPTITMRLKEAAECLGYEFSYPELDGWAVAHEYQQAIRSGKSVPDRLLAYNRDDVLALRFLIHEVERLAAEI